MFWSTALSFLVFGINEATARLPALFALHLSPRWQPHTLVLLTMSSLVYFKVFLYVWENTFSGHRYNQKPMIDAYERQSVSDPCPLICTGASRFSVEFYTEGRVAFFARPGAHYTVGTLYVAVRDMGQREQPSDRCRALMHRGEFTLWYCPARTASQSLARASDPATEAMTDP